MRILTEVFAHRWPPTLEPRSAEALQVAVASNWSTLPRQRRTVTAMRRFSLGWIVGLGLLPFVVGATPSPPQAAAVPQVCHGIPSGTPLIGGLELVGKLWFGRTT